MSRAIALPTVALLAITATAQVPDWRRLPTPSGTATKGLAFDLARERMVLFESCGWSHVSRTWEWVGDNWSLRRTSTTPPPRLAFAFAYDPQRQRCVMFGGSTVHYWTAPGVLLADTWEYDGRDWTQRFPTTFPPAQVAAWMGFDPASQKLLLCGGTSTPTSAGAWHFDGTTWTPTTPAPFYAHSVALGSDPLRQKILAQTVSYPGNVPTASTLEWDGAAWQTLQPTTQTTPLHGRMAFVAQRGTMVLHGAPVPPSNAPAELWEWNGSQWSQLPQPMPPQVGAAMEHDPRRNRTITFSGHDVGSETWQWDGSNWTHTVDSLGQEFLRHSTFDWNSGSVVAVTNHPPRTVAWDGTHWHRDPAPPGMGDSLGLAFDVSRSRLVAIGTASGQGLNTWEHDGTSWTVAQPTPALPSGTIYQLLYHRARGHVIACSTAGLWEWDGVAWTSLGAGPSSMWCGATYDQARNEIVVPQTFTASTLPVSSWNGASWTTTIPATSPPVRIVYNFHGIGYDEARQRVVTFGGRDPTNGPSPYGFFRFFNDLWEWDGTNWAQRLLPTTPAAREASALVFDPIRQHLLLLGGNRQEYNGAYLMFSEVWALDATTPAAVTTLGPGCGGAQLPHLLPSAPHPGASAFTLDMNSASANAPTLFLLALGTGQIAIGGGCTSFVANPDLLTVAITNASGYASSHTAIPLALLGMSFTAQAALLDSSTPRGFALSEGLRITVGY